MRERERASEHEREGEKSTFFLETNVPKKYKKKLPRPETRAPGDVTTVVPDLSIFFLVPLGETGLKRGSCLD